jgi:hypothetical protein
VSIFVNGGETSLLCVFSTLCILSGIVVILGACFGTGARTASHVTRTFGPSAACMTNRTVRARTFDGPDVAVRHASRETEKRTRWPRETKVCLEQGVAQDVCIVAVRLD